MFSAKSITIRFRFLTNIGLTRIIPEVTLSQALENKKIFLIDDEPEMRIFLFNLLASGGFEPMVVESGTADIQHVSDQKPALIILNILKYRDSNMLLYRDLKLDEKLKKIPVIMLSNLDRRTFFHYQKLKNKSLGQGIPEPDAYLVKPPEVDELLQLVRELTQTSDADATEEMV